MKKLIPLILTAALTLAACASASDETPLTTPTPVPEAPEPTSTPAPATTDFYPLESYTTAFNTGDAYYELVPYPGHALLLKTDYATAAQTVCCTMPNCAHDSEACPAYFPGRARRYTVFTAGDTLYVYHTLFFRNTQTWEEYFDEYGKPQLEHPDQSFEGLTADEITADFYGRWTEQTTPPCLYTVHPGGGKVRTDLPEEVRDYVMTYCDGAAVYGAAWNDENGTTAIGCRISLADGAVQTFPLLTQEQFLDVCGDALVTSHIVTDAPLPTDREQYQAAIQSAETEYDLYDPNDGTRTRLAAYPYDTSALLGVYGGKAYFEKRQPIPYAAYEPVAVETLDIATGTTETIWTPEQGAQELPLGDAEGHSLRMSESDVIVGQRTSLPVGFRAAAADGRWLVTTGKDETTNRENYALVEPEQFMAGSAEQETVTMWQG